MKIIFINPYCLDPRLIDYDIKIPPIGVYYLAAYLIEQGHECSILNWYNMKGREKEMVQQITAISPDIVCISTLHANRWGAIDIAKIIKRLLPDVNVIFGGPGATFLWKHLLSNFQEIDFIIIGEGELTLSELIQNLSLSSNKKRGLAKIKGLAYRNNDQIIITEPREFITDLDVLPDPSRYFNFQHIISSRGCPWNCTFCGSPKFWQRKVRFHSSEYFVNQIKRLVQKGNNFFFVSDDTFTLKKDRVIKICKKIIEEKLNITWVAISRVNIVDEEILYWMRLAGCIQISYGVESGSYKIRKVLNKNITDGEIKKAFELTRAYGLMPRAYFIYGNPGETKDTVKQTIRLIDKIKPLGAIFYILDIFPGTKLYEDFKKRTKNDDDIWLKKIEDIMYFETDPALNEHKILEYGKKLRRHFYKKLPSFALDIKLVKAPNLYSFHADFLSRLAMTFAFGDYAKIEEIPNKLQTAEKLFLRSLDFFPDHRAFLGLGMLYQRSNMHQKAIEILQQGQKHYPHSEQINVCLAVSLMNTGLFNKALTHLLPFTNTIQNINYALICARHLGEKELYNKLNSKLKELQLRQRIR